jgi:N-acetylneuraminic acid mutarotase
MAVGPRPHYETNSVYVPATNEMIVWSGVDEDGASLSDGIAYNVGANSWRTIAASPLSARKYASAVWDGSRVIYAFGCTSAGTVCTDVGDAAAYDPVLDTWTMLPVPPAAKRTRTLAHRTIGASGAELAAFFGGTSGGAPTHDGLLFDTPWTTWKTLPDPLLPGAARIEFGAWTGASGKLFVWGGVSAKGDGTSEYFADGAVFDPIASTWTPMPSGGPSARRAPVGVWTGCDTIVFGGASAAGWEATGMLYRP